MVRKLVAIRVDSFNPETEKISKQAYDGEHAIIACANEQGCHTHISGKITGPDLLALMLALTERVEQMLITNFDYPDDLDLPFALASIRHEMQDTGEGRTHH